MASQHHHATETPSKHIAWTFKIHMEQDSLPSEHGDVTKKHQGPEERGSLGGSDLLRSSPVTLFIELSGDEH